VNELLRHLLHLPEQRSSIARSVDYLHYTVILCTIGGALLAAGFGAIFLVRYRRQSKTIPLTPYVVAPRWLEAGVIVGVLALFCGFWFVGFSQYRTIESVPADAMPVYVTAKQWMWKFDYPGGPTSANVLTVPVGQPIKLIMTSRDVIHSFYVPDFRIKQDVVPGRTMTTWFEAIEPGTSEVLCSQYCGTRHSQMRAQIVALAPENYARWLAAAHGPLALPGAKGDGSGLAARGHAVAADHGCLRCHSVDGTPFIGPTWANVFGTQRKTSDGRSLLVDEAYLTESMMDPRAAVAAGFAPVMPSYQGLLEPEDISALVEYIRSLRDVTPHVAEPPPVAPISYPQGATP